MSAIVASDTGEAAILCRVFGVEQPLSPEAAKYLLNMGFPSDDQQRMDWLAEKARQGLLTTDERDELSHYCHVGDLLALVKSKARLALMDTPPKG